MKRETEDCSDFAVRIEFMRDAVTTDLPKQSEKIVDEEHGQSRWD